MPSFPLNQDSALDLLIAFAPTWHISIERRTAYGSDSHRVTSSYDLFVFFPTPDESVKSLFRGQDLIDLVNQAKTYITQQQIEQALTCPITNINT